MLRILELLCEERQSLWPPPSSEGGRADHGLSSPTLHPVVGHGRRPRARVKRSAPHRIGRLSCLPIDRATWRSPRGQACCARRASLPRCGGVQWDGLERGPPCGCWRCREEPQKGGGCVWNRSSIARRTRSASGADDVESSADPSPAAKAGEAPGGQRAGQARQDHDPWGCGASRPRQPRRDAPAQYSSGSKIVVTLRSASVINQSCSSSRV